MGFPALYSPEMPLLNNLALSPTLYKTVQVTLQWVSPAKLGQLFDTDTFISPEGFRPLGEVTILSLFAYYRLQHAVSVCWADFPQEPKEYPLLTQMYFITNTRGWVDKLYRLTGEALPVARCCPRFRIFGLNWSRLSMKSLETYCHMHHSSCCWGL